MGQRHVAQAKTILMRTHQVSEDQAYDLIREQAMNKRSTIEDISIAIVNASEVLSLGQKGSSLLGN
jgi:AmiR/NasT family two-component response regulator